MKYKNTINGTIIDTVSEISGEMWEEIASKKGKKKENPAVEASDENASNDDALPEETA